MLSSTFFRLFPPPKFMTMQHSGLDISDDAIHCLEYKLIGKTVVGFRKFAHVDMPDGLVEGGDVKDEQALKKILKSFDDKNDLSYVKVSIPEEKAYLFQIEVPDADVRSIEQNIEFKLEENVPLAASDAVFYFDLLPLSVTGGVLKASVSVVPRTYVEKYINMLRESGILPVSFEVVPKSIARAVLPPSPDRAQMIIHIMSKKTGIYVVSGGVVCFTSTLTWDTAAFESGSDKHISLLAAEVNRIYPYWMSHSVVASTIDQIILVGRDAPKFESSLRNVLSEATPPVRVANVWRNTFDLSKHIPTISKDRSFDYAVAAGLAME